MSQDNTSAGKEPVSESDRLMSLVASAAISQAMAVAENRPCIDDDVNVEATAWTGRCISTPRH